jgi:arylsulfatase A-like enzyme/uncharacterized membrane protein YbhN (UPF0104 family)
MAQETNPEPARAGHPLRAALRFAVKLVLTVGAFYLLLMHHVTDADGNRVTTFTVIRGFLPNIDIRLFFEFVLLATAIKMIGILASMARWWLLLRGQGIDLPFRHIAGSFLIGRFLGTFLPSTIGLDGYKLYDAARFSGRSVEASGATLVEKIIGFTGIFVTYLVAMPFGVSIFGERAMQIALLTTPVALAPLLLAFLVFAWPGPRLVDGIAARLPAGPYRGFLDRLTGAVTAYRGKPGTILLVALLSFVVHFTTAAMYFFTALAIGVTAAEASFWQVTFASIIQILATVLSPFTIAGEGIREIAQYYLVSHLMGPAEAIVSAALGFWAAEAVTLVGGIIWWVRGDSYVPGFCRVNGRQVDYAAAALAARDLGVTVQPDGTQGTARVAALVPRLLCGLLLGAAGGIFAGIALGIGEGATTFALSGAGEDMQVLWYAIALYGVIGAAIGAGVGVALGVLPLASGSARRWIPTLAFVAGFFPLGLAVALFRLQRDTYHEQRPPIVVMLAALGAGMLLTVLGAWLMARFKARASDTAPLVGASRRLGVAVGAWVAVLLIGVVAARALAPAPPPAVAVRTDVPAALRDKPNVVLVIIDTLRADHLGVYGDPRALTPHMDALAKDGSTFHTAGQASWTKPSIATILTSLYPSTHGAMSKTALLPNVPTVAAVMAESGYSTAGFVSNINLAPSFNFQQGFAEYTYLAPDYLFGADESSSKLVLYNLVRKIWFTVNKKRWVTQYYQDSRTVNEHVLPWLEQHRNDRFFLLVHYMDPHDPYFRHPYDGFGIARVENPNPDAKLAPLMRELYAGEVKHVDESLGTLVARLRELGIYDQTALVITADHGEEFHDHGGWWHGTTLYHEQIGVPLIAKWPAGNAPGIGAQPGGIAQLLDVAPTILATAKVAAPASWQGVDLRGGVPDRPVFAEEDHEGNVLSAVQVKDTKLIRANPGNPRGLPPVALYDREADPDELRNIAEQNPTAVAHLETTLSEFGTRTADQAVASGGDVKMDEATRDRLRALGYVQ